MVYIKVVKMNSAQRRKANREFPHQVEIQAEESQRYFDHDHKISVAQTWCRRQFGQVNFRCQTDWDHAVFKFAREKDAVHFALKWR